MKTYEELYSLYSKLAVAPQTGSAGEYVERFCMILLLVFPTTIRTASISSAVLCAYGGSLENTSNTSHGKLAALSNDSKRPDLCCQKGLIIER